MGFLFETSHITSSTPIQTPPPSPKTTSGSESEGKAVPSSIISQARPSDKTLVALHEETQKTTIIRDIAKLSLDELRLAFDKAFTVDKRLACLQKMGLLVGAKIEDYILTYHFVQQPLQSTEGPYVIIEFRKKNADDFKPPRAIKVTLNQIPMETLSSVNTLLKAILQKKSELKRGS